MNEDEQFLGTNIQPNNNNLGVLDTAYEPNQLDAFRHKRNVDFLNKQPKIQSKQSNLSNKYNSKLFNLGLESTIPQEDNKSSNPLRALGSEALRTTYDLADTAIEAGANLVGGAVDLAGMRKYYTKDEEAYAKSYLDPLTQSKTTDEMFGYDSTNYDATVNDISKDIDNGNYFDAVMKGISISPTSVAKSIPQIAALFVGGSTKAVVKAGETAYKGAIALGATKAAAEAAAKVAKADATKSLSLMGKVGNLATKNTGLLTVSAAQVKNQDEQFAKNNNGEGMSGWQKTRAMGISVLTNAIDKFAFKDITGLGKSKKEIKAIWGELDKVGKKAVMSKLAMLPKDMGEEAATEFIQTFGEIVNENWGANGQSLQDILTKRENIVKAGTGSAIGAGAGGLMSVPKTVSGTLNEAGKGKRQANIDKGIDNQLSAGFNTSNDKQKNLDAVIKNHGDAKSLFDELDKTEQEIKSINESDSTAFEKIAKIQAIISPKIESDNQQISAISKLGSTEIKNIIKTLESNELLNEQEGFKTFIEEVKNANSPMEAQAMFDEVVPQIAEHLTQEQKNDYNKANERITKKAESAVNLGLTDITFNNAKKQMNQRGIVAEKVATKIDSMEEPIKDNHIDYEAMASMSNDELKAELSKYDLNSLNKIGKSAPKEMKTNNPEMSASDIRSKADRLRRAIVDTINNLRTNDSRKVQSTIRKIKAERKKNKKAYDPKMSIIDKFKNFVSETKDKIHEAADQARKSGKKQDNAAEEYKDTTRALVDSIRESETLSQDDLAQIAETIDDLKDVGAITETKHKNMKRKLDEITDADIVSEKDTRTKDTSSDENVAESEIIDEKAEKQKKKNQKKNKQKNISDSVTIAKSNVEVLNKQFKQARKEVAALNKAAIDADEKSKKKAFELAADANKDMLLIGAKLATAKAVLVSAQASEKVNSDEFQQKKDEVITKTSEIVDEVINSETVDKARKAGKSFLNSVKNFDYKEFADGIGDIITDIKNGKKINEIKEPLQINGIKMEDC